MLRTFAAYGGLCAALFTLASCTDWRVQNETMPTATDGAAFFAANCVACHGPDARGTGDIAAELPSNPIDLTLLSRRNGGDFPAARALSYIYGDPNDGHLARVMPEFGGAMAEDVVPLEIDGVLTPTPRELAGLLAYLEQIQR